MLRASAPKDAHVEDSVTLGEVQTVLAPLPVVANRARREATPLRGSFGVVGSQAHVPRVHTQPSGQEKARRPRAARSARVARSTRPENFRNTSPSALWTDRSRHLFHMFGFSSDEDEAQDCQRALFRARGMHDLSIRFCRALELAGVVCCRL